MGMRIPPLKIQIMLESNRLKSRILVRRLAVDSAKSQSTRPPQAGTNAQSSLQALK